MPDLRRTALVALAVVVLAGCSTDPTTPVAPGPSVSAASAAPSPTPSPEATSATPTPSSTPTPTSPGPQSETYANDLSVADDGQVSYTPLRWYQGQRAEDRCEKVGISSPTAWCHDYYYEKAGSTARAALTDDTAIKLLDDDGRLKTSGAAQFRQAVADESWPNFRLWLVGDEIERVEQVYTP